MVLQVLNPAISFPALQTGYPSPSGTGHTFFALCFIIGLPVRATVNQEYPSIYVEERQNGERNSQSVLRIPPPPSPPLLWGRFLQGGDGLSQVVWRTDLEVDLTRTQNYCEELLALYLRRTIIEKTVFG